MSLEFLLSEPQYSLRQSEKERYLLPLLNDLTRRHREARSAWVPRRQGHLSAARTVDRWVPALAGNPLCAMRYRLNGWPGSPGAFARNV